MKRRHTLHTPLLARAPLPALVRLARYLGVPPPVGTTEAERLALAIRVGAAIQGGAGRGMGR